MQNLGLGEMGREGLGEKPEKSTQKKSSSRVRRPRCGRGVDGPWVQRSPSYVQWC